MFLGFSFKPDQDPWHSNVKTRGIRINNAYRGCIQLTQIVFTLLSPKVLYLRWQPSILLICTVSLHAVCTYEVPRFSLFPLLVKIGLWYWSAMLQAREDVIHMLKTEKTKPEVLEAHYGSAAPESVLRVLHRDAILAQEKSIGEDVYEKPMSEVKTSQFTSSSLCRGIPNQKRNCMHFVCMQNMPEDNIMLVEMTRNRRKKWIFLLT